MESSWEPNNQATADSARVVGSRCSALGTSRWKPPMGVRGAVGASRRVEAMWMLFVLTWTGGLVGFLELKRMYASKASCFMVCFESTVRKAVQCYGEITVTSHGAVALPRYSHTWAWQDTVQEPNFLIQGHRRDVFQATLTPPQP